MKITHPTRISARSGLLASAAALISVSAVAQQTAQIPEVQVQASAVIKRQEGKSSSGAPIETAVVMMRVGYSDLSLATNSGQALLKERVATAARDACARVGAQFTLGSAMTSDSDCVRTAISDAKAQIDAAIESANAHKVGAR